MLRKLSIYLAFIQLFSGGVDSFTKSVIFNHIFKPKTTIQEMYSKSDDDILLVDSNNPNNLIYKRVDSDTGEYNDISIYDKENIASHQYGANQKVFEVQFASLFVDKNIKEEVEKIMPLDSFSDSDEARRYYKIFFNFIDDNGCGYVAATNRIFRLFEGREEDFYNAFGFPMYIVIGEYVDFNYEPMILKFFNYSIIKKFGSIDYVRSSIKRIIKENKDNEFGEINTDYGIKLNVDFGYIIEFLKEYGIDVDVNVLEGLAGSNIDDIVAVDDFKLYVVNQDGTIQRTIEKDDPHYVSITGQTEDGQFICSSWGYPYVLDDNCSWASRVLINEK